MSGKCITDYIPIDDLQVILDETALQDNIAVRMWSPHLAKTDGYGWVTPDWNNACHFHTLIRSYPSGEACCYQFFESTAQEIANQTAAGNTSINWHLRQCPTSLYVFGYPLLDESGNILGIVFGGLVRDVSADLSDAAWGEMKATLEKDNALIRELENEFCYVPALDENERKRIFTKWKLFCEALTRAIPRMQAISDSVLVGKVMGTYSCLCVGSDLVLVAQQHQKKIELILIDRYEDIHSVDYYGIHISSEGIELASVEKRYDSDGGALLTIPVSQKADMLLAFKEEYIDQQEKKFILEVGKTIISGAFARRKKQDAHYGKVLLSRQSQIFEEISKKSVTDLGRMIEKLFDRLKETGVVNIDFASFSEVVYFSDEKNSKPKFKARVVYPEKAWTDAQKNIIESFDLYADCSKDYGGSTVYAFQTARPVIDRVVGKSPTYISTQKSVKSSLVIPVTYGPLMLGVIALDSEEENYFDEGRLLQMESLVHLLSPIIYHNSFQEKLSQSNKKMVVLGRDFSRKSIIEIRRAILIELSRLVQAEAASFWVLDSSRSKLKRDFSIGDVKGLLDYIGLVDSSLGVLYRSDMDNSVIVRDLDNEKDSNILLYSKELRNCGFLSYLAFPVKIGDEKVLISFYRKRNKKLVRREFSDIELNITRKLGEILSFYEGLSNIFDNSRRNLNRQIKAREEMAITLAHNIKLPLSSASAYLQGLEAKIEKNEENSESIIYYEQAFDKIKDCFFLIKRPIDSVLNSFASEEKYDNIAFNVQGFHLYYDIVAKLLAIIRRGVEIRGGIYKRVVEVSGQKQFPILYGEKSDVESMIFNVLENSIKYSEEGDKIFIETKFDYTDGKVELYIRNEGDFLISNEDAKMIFDYGYRSQMARDKDPHSTGIGLYYSRYIARRHGGDLSLERKSSPVVFKITLYVDKLKTKEVAERTLRSSFKEKGGLV